MYIKRTIFNIEAPTSASQASVTSSPCSNCNLTIWGSSRRVGSIDLREKGKKKEKKKQIITEHPWSRKKKLVFPPLCLSSPFKLLQSGIPSAPSSTRASPISVCVCARCAMNLVFHAKCARLYFVRARKSGIRRRHGMHRAHTKSVDHDDLCKNCIPPRVLATPFPF